jgi:hypothetical protein
MITHILGPVGRANLACIHASAEAKAAADTLRLLSNVEVLRPIASTDDSIPSAQAKRTRSGSSITESSQAKKLKGPLAAFTYKGIDMPFSASEKEAVKAQSLRAVISANLPFRVFEDPEVLKLIKMLRTTGPEIMPTGKVVGGRLLNEASTVSGAKLAKLLRGRDIGLW